MKRLAILAVVVVVSSAASNEFPFALVSEYPEKMWWAMGGMLTMTTDYAKPVVDCGTQTVKPYVDLSSGSFIRMNISGNCNQFDYINPNGSTVPPLGRYIACPK